MLNLRLKLKQTVRETPVINGFSYAFLKLLVERVRDLEKQNELYADWKPAGSNHVVVDAEVEGILNLIGNQIGKSNYATAGASTPMKEIVNLISAAEAILKLFEMTREEFLESQRTPEKP